VELVDREAPGRAPDVASVRRGLAEGHGRVSLGQRRRDGSDGCGAPRDACDGTGCARAAPAEERRTEGGREAHDREARGRAPHQSILRYEGEVTIARTSAR
jgi:hypothetical protein